MNNTFGNYTDEGIYSTKVLQEYSSSLFNYNKNEYNFGNYIHFSESLIKANEDAVFYFVERDRFYLLDKNIRAGFFKASKESYFYLINNPNDELIIESNYRILEEPKTLKIRGGDKTGWIETDTLFRFKLIELVEKSYEEVWINRKNLQIKKVNPLIYNYENYKEEFIRDFEFEYKTFTELVKKENDTTTYTYGNTSDTSGLF